MTRQRFRVAALVGLLAGFAISLLFPLAAERMTGLRETVFDALLTAGHWGHAVTPAGQVIIIDVDRDSLSELGPWPWPRGNIARLVDAALAQGAGAIALDIVFAGPDQRSPGTAVRHLAKETGITALGDIAATLADGDLLLASALGRHPTVIAFLLDSLGKPLTAIAPVLVRNGAALGGIWGSSGAQLPLPELAQAVAGLGVASLPGDSDGIIRRVPLLVAVGDKTAPGLAAEVLRVAAEASGFLATGPRLTLAIGDVQLALPADGMLRLLPSAVMPKPLRLGAADVIAGRIDGRVLKGAVVFVGASAPEIGGLRPSLLGPLTPSVDLHARAAWQIMAGVSPLRLPWSATLEVLAAMLSATVAVWTAIAMRPVKGLAILVLLAIAIVAAACALAWVDLLHDPMPALASLSGSFVAASLGVYAETRRRETLLRRRFEQHLAPGIVERIAAAPDSLKLAGERRCITALFTDVEGFSATASSVTPEQLILVLDGYFEGVAAIIIRHGGMIDKFVGDAVHAFFNMPFDMEDHADCAVACAIDIVRWAEAHRKDGLAQQIGFGRTRIGVETGSAVVGDVGLTNKLDYTAHGTAVNVAARLEGLNKDFSTAICIGPGTAAACLKAKLRPLGPVEVRGVGMLEVYTIMDA